MLSQQDKSKSMSDTVFYQGMARETFPPARFGSVKASLNALHRFVAPKVTKEFTHRRARSIWEGTAKRIDAEEAAALRKAQIQEAHREREELQARLSRLDAALAAADEEFHRPTLEAIRYQARHSVGRTTG